MSYRITGSGNRVDVEIDGINGRKGDIIRAFENCRLGCEFCPAAGVGNLESFEVEDAGDGLKLHLVARKGTRIDQGEVAQCVEFTVNKRG